MFIRKLLDFFFTQFEMGEIDDKLPEKQKKQKQDAEERELKEEEEVSTCYILCDTRDFAFFVFERT